MTQGNMAQTLSRVMQLSHSYLNAVVALIGIAFCDIYLLMLIPITTIQLNFALLSGIDKNDKANQKGLDWLCMKK